MCLAGYTGLRPTTAPANRPALANRPPQLPFGLEPQVANGGCLRSQTARTAKEPPAEPRCLRIFFLNKARPRGELERGLLSTRHADQGVTAKGRLLGGVVRNAVGEVDHDPVQVLGERHHARQAGAVGDLVRVPDRLEEGHLGVGAGGQFREPVLGDHHVVVAQLRPLPKQVLGPPLAVDFEHGGAHNLGANVDLVCTKIVATRIQQRGTKESPKLN